MMKLKNIFLKITVQVFKFKKQNGNASNWKVMISKTVIQSFNRYITLVNISVSLYFLISTNRPLWYDDLISVRESVNMNKFELIFRYDTCLSFDECVSSCTIMTSQMIIMAPF